MTTVEEVGAAERQPDPGAETRARRSVARTFRPSRSWPALLAGLVLLAGAVLIAAEVISTLVGSPLGIIPVGAIVPVLSGTGWNHPAVLGVSGALVLLGLILLVAALVPGRGGYLPLRTDDPALAVGLSRAGMRSALATAAREVDGVEGARVSLGRRRVRIRASTHLRTTDGLHDAVGAAIRERLAELAPLRPLRIRVRIKLAKA